MTRVVTESRRSNGTKASGTTYEVEFELGAAATAHWVRNPKPYTLNPTPESLHATTAHWVRNPKP